MVKNDFESTKIKDLFILTKIENLKERMTRINFSEMVAIKLIVQDFIDVVEGIEMTKFMKRFLEQKSTEKEIKIKEPMNEIKETEEVNSLVNTFIKDIRNIGNTREESLDQSIDKYKKLVDDFVRVGNHQIEENRLPTFYIYRSIDQEILL